jgi:outer membrane protein assembly factor BamA
LKKPITPTLCKLAMVCTFVGGLARAQTASPPASPQAQAESSYATGSLNKYDGRTVDAIEFQGIGGTDPARLRSLLDQQANEALEREKLRASIKTLYATGRFATINVEAEPVSSDRVRLIFVVTENYFNGVVTVEGTPKKGNPKPHQLVAASQLDLGDVFTEDKVVSSVDRMKKIMADNGYYEAVITYTLQPNASLNQMAIDFHVIPGTLARVGAVTIQGDAGIPPEQVRSLTKLKAAQALSEKRAPGGGSLADRPAISRGQRPAGLCVQGRAGADGEHCCPRRRGEQEPVEEADSGVPGELGRR